MSERDRLARMSTFMMDSLERHPDYEGESAIVFITGHGEEAGLIFHGFQNDVERAIGELGAAIFAMLSDETGPATTSNGGLKFEI